MRNSSVDFVSLRYLSVSADAGNFGRAAKALGVQTSTVSRSVARTEDELGVTLFERGHFGIRLTAAGRAVMVHVRRVLAEVEAVKTSGHRNGSGNVGQIRLGVRMPPVGTPLQPLLDWRIAWARLFSLLLVPASEPTLRSVDRMAALNSMPQ